MLDEKIDEQIGQMSCVKKWNEKQCSKGGPFLLRGLEVEIEGNKMKEWEIR